MYLKPKMIDEFWTMINVGEGETDTYTEVDYDEKLIRVYKNTYLHEVIIPGNSYLTKFKLIKQRGDF